MRRLTIVLFAIALSACGSSLAPNAPITTPESIIVATPDRATNVAPTNISTMPTINPTDSIIIMENALYKTPTVQP